MFTPRLRKANRIAFMMHADNLMHGQDKPFTIRVRRPSLWRRLVARGGSVQYLREWELGLK